MRVLRASLIALTLALVSHEAVAQGGIHTLFGDLHVEEGQSGELKPIVYEVVLYNLGGVVVARQFVNAGGRYRFLNVANGQYYVAVLLDNEEIGRTRVEVLAPTKSDFRQDLSLEWRATSPSRAKQTTVSAADFYKRTAENQRLFEKARKATDDKRYDDAIAALQGLVKADAADFQGWTELGTLYLLKQDYENSERAYEKAIAVRPTFFLALMNLGRLRSLRKNFAGAIEPLLAANRLKTDSADANYYLGEAYLQVRKGSLAVNYLNKALELDPVGKANAHLLLAALYNAVGQSEKAAAEYRAFLKKKPDYPNRKKLEQYIARNGKVSDSTKPQ